MAANSEQICSIVESYRNLRRKGVQFPTTAEMESSNNPGTAISICHDGDDLTFFSEDAFNLKSGPNQSSAISSSSTSVSNANFEEDSLPFDEKQFSQLEKLIKILRTSDDSQLVERALTLCDQLKPRLETALRQLTMKLNSSTTRKLRTSDARVGQLNAILDLDTEVKRRRGVRLLQTTNTSPTSVNGSTAAPPSQTQQQLKASKPVDLLEDLLNDEDENFEKEEVELSAQSVSAAPQFDTSVWNAAPAAMAGGGGFALFGAPEEWTKPNPLENSNLAKMPLPPLSPQKQPFEEPDTFVDVPTTKAEGWTTAI